MSAIKIGTKCIVNGCSNATQGDTDLASGLTFHRLPTHRPELSKKWLKIINQGPGFVPLRTMIVCSDHFPDDSFQMRQGKRILKANAVPTLPPKDNCNDSSAAVHHASSAIRIFSEDSFQPVSANEIVCETPAPTSTPVVRNEKNGCEVDSKEMNVVADECVADVDADVDAGDENKAAGEQTVLMIHSYAHVNDERNELKQRIEDLEAQNQEVRDELKSEREKNIQLRKRALQLQRNDITTSSDGLKMSIAYIRF